MSVITAHFLQLEISDLTSLWQTLEQPYLSESLEDLDGWLNFSRLRHAQNQSLMGTVKWFKIAEG